MLKAALPTVQLQHGHTLASLIAPFEKASSFQKKKQVMPLSRPEDRTWHWSRFINGIRAFPN